MQIDRAMYTPFLVLPLLISACGDDGTPADGSTDAGGDAVVDGSPDALPDGGGGDEPTYAFESRFNPSESSVNHAGQTTRQILLADLIAEMRRLSAGVRDGSVEPTTVDEVGEVVARLDGIYRSGSTDLATRPLPSLTSGDDTLCQATYEDLGDADLVSKTAGMDTSTDHRDWSSEWVGWSDASVLGDAPLGSPVALTDALFTTFEEQVRACALDVSACPETAAGDPLPLHVTPDGLDLIQLVQKHLLGAIHFSQGTDDYLDDDVADKGLLTDNTMPREDGAPDTLLEHAWDEAFGYFGAAADYDDYTDDEIRGEAGRPEYASGYHDTDGDACIDVFTEYNFAASVNAAKRDAGATTMVDLTAEAFDAFVAGRMLIAEADGAPDATALAGHRDAAVSAWERALSATVIHYVNEVLAHMNACSSMEYSFEDHAKHWSELKGFALAFQYNPRSPWNDTSDFAALHAAIGDSPVLCDGDVSGYETVLLGVRDSVRDAYGFDASDAEGW